MGWQRHKPRLAKLVLLRGKTGKTKFDKKYKSKEAVDEKVIARVSSALPEFEMAFEPDGLSCRQFGTYGAVEMTLDAFDRTGWARLRDL